MVDPKKPVAHGASAPKAETKALTPEEAAAKKAADEAKKVEAEANEKVGKINANLVKDGSPRRIMANIRDGKPAYFWANMTPTAALTEDELEAVEAM